MPCSKKPRKKYNPNKNQSDVPINIRYSKAEGDSLKYRIYYHLYRLTTQDCDAGDYLAIEFRLRIGCGLVELFDKGEPNKVIDEGFMLLKQIKQRRLEKGSWTITPNQEDRLRLVLSVIDDLQDATTRAEQLPVFIDAERKIEHQLRIDLP